MNPSLGRVVALTAILASSVAGSGLHSQNRSSKAQRELGELLFFETTLNNPGATFQSGCGGCHFVGKAPRGGRERFYSEQVPRSLMPGQGSARQETTLRNTPALLDLDGAHRFGIDGRFASLEELVGEKIFSNHLGWQSKDRARAEGQLKTALLDDPAVDYQPKFQAAYRADIETLSEKEVVDLTVRALTQYTGEIQSARTATWDAFADQNRIPLGPARDEDPKHYAGRIYGRLTNQEGRVLIKRPVGFSEEAYQGFKTFFRVEGNASVGNCVSCHVPPDFTDGLFHNTGISELEYTDVNSARALAKLPIAEAAAAGRRPDSDFLAVPTKSNKSKIDLGHWNWVDLENSPQRVEGETDDALLQRMIGAFRTPSLRNLPRTDPYMHNGAYPTLESAVANIVRVNSLAREGKLHSIDPDYLLMKLAESDIAPLVAFLRSIDEVGEAEFRELLITFE